MIQNKISRINTICNKLNDDYFILNDEDRKWITELLQGKKSLSFKEKLNNIYCHDRKSSFRFKTIFGYH